jgi:hypothetical protein
VAWDRLYGLERWRKRTRMNLRLHPLCAECERQGRVQEATLSHHVEEYRPGDSDLKFWFGALESLCNDCHAKVHGRPVKLPYRRDIDPDGWPADFMHPVHVEERRREEQERKWAKSTKP